MEIREARFQTHAVLLVVLSASVSSPFGWSNDDLSDWSGGDTSEPAINSTRLEHSPHTAPIATTIITRRDIRAAGYLTIHEIFRSVPGFRVSVIGTEKRLSYHGTAVRQNRRLRVTVDGLNNLIGDGSYVEFNRLPFTVDDVARVVITRGTNGASFGDNAFLASIDFQLVDSNDLESNVRVGLGSSGRESLSATGRHDTPHYGVVLRANRYSIEEHEYFGTRGVPGGSTEKIDRLHASVLAKDLDLKISASWYDAYHHIADLREVGPSYQDNSGWSLGLAQKLDLALDARLDWSLSHTAQEELLVRSSCFDETLQQLVDSTLPEERDSLLVRANILSAFLQRPLEDICGRIDIGIQSDRTDAEIEYNYLTDSASFVVGLSATYVDAKSPRYFVDAEQQATVRVFSEANVSYDDLSLNMGLMTQYADNIDDYKTAVRLALNWAVSPNQSLRFAAARSFRIPSLVESHASWSLQAELINVDIPVPGFSGLVETNGQSVSEGSRVRAEELHASEIGYVLGRPDSLIRLDAKLFYEEIKNPIRYGVFFFGDLPFNDKSYDMSGMEMHIEYRPAPQVELAASYSYIDSNAKSVSERGLYGRHAGSASATYLIDNKRSVSLAYYGNSKIALIGYGRTDISYVQSVDFYAGELEFSAVGQHFESTRQGNLIDGRTPDPVFLDSNFQFMASLAYRW